ncbi:uncharacterized protein LOC126592233 [Malus sylvestris]|uniref:uncharacterized protein LOC126592233 n=1 Tax=Malus sylvestris TaxID=3752 RepID=UPI0021ABF4E0|nr:uncharacterized protein LOC126592233 [Malus sylvestris]
MANLAKLDYATLDITGKNYLTWVLDTKIHLEAENLGDTIREESSSSSQERAKAMIFIRCHFDEALKSEYLTVEDPLTLWNALRSRYNHQTMVPRARYEWTHLRIQDFKSVAEYNFALFRITSQLKLYRDTITEENLLEKTFSTFHASNVLLQQQYRARAEQNNEFLMKNHHSRPTGSAPFPEVNTASLEVNVTSSGGDNHKRGCGHKQVVTEIILSDDIEPHSVNECKQRQDWPKWKDVIQDTHSDTEDPTSIATVMRCKERRRSNSGRHLLVQSENNHQILKLAGSVHVVGKKAAGISADFKGIG